MLKLRLYEGDDEKRREYVVCLNLAFRVSRGEGRAWCDLWPFGGFPRNPNLRIRSK